MKIICFGDSNTYGYDPRSYLAERYEKSKRWTGILENFIEYEILNKGENGRRVPCIPGDNVYLSFLNCCKQEDILIIMLGTNDILRGEDAEETAKRMKCFITDLKHSIENIILISPPPLENGLWVTDKRLILQSKKLANYYESIAKELGLKYVNSGEWGIELCFDGVHFSEEGHKVFAHNLYTIIKQKTART